MGVWLTTVIWVLIMASLVGCGHFDIIKPKSPQASKLQLLQARYDENLAKLGNRWPSRSDCDAVLWASISKHGGNDVDITESQAESGQWFRRPGKDCFSTASSRSSFSNDMALGIVLAASTHDIKRWFNWVKRNNYRMGPGDPGAAVLKPNVMAVIGRRVGWNLGPRYPYVSNSRDYVRHIQTLMIYVDGLSTGYITKGELSLLKRYNDGRDYLIASVLAKYTGDFDAAVGLLLEEGEPPSYVRGDSPEMFRLAHWVMSAKIVLGVK